MKKLMLSGIIAIVLAATLAMSVEFTTEKAAPSGSFDSSIDYDIYYVVSEFEVDLIEGVNIVGVEEISERKFLVVLKGGFTAKVRKAYIDYDAVKAILPSTHIKPDRTIVRD